VVRDVGSGPSCVLIAKTFQPQKGKLKGGRGSRGQSNVELEKRCSFEFHGGRAEKKKLGGLRVCSEAPRLCHGKKKVQRRGRRMPFGKKLKGGGDWAVIRRGMPWGGW